MRSGTLLTVQKAARDRMSDDLGQLVLDWLFRGNVVFSGMRHCSVDLKWIKKKKKEKGRKDQDTDYFNDNENGDLKWYFSLDMYAHLSLSMYHFLLLHMKLTQWKGFIWEQYIATNNSHPSCSACWYGAYNTFQSAQVGAKFDRWYKPFSKRTFLLPQNRYVGEITCRGV